MSCFPQHDIFRLDRATKRGGGVLIAAHHRLQCSPLNIPSALELIFIRCNNSYPPLIIGACYRPPDSDPSFVTEFHSALNLLSISNPSAHMLILGDFNFPTITWSDLVLTTSKCSVESDFVDTCLTFGLSQLVSAPTRESNNSSNILDLLLTSHADSLSPLTHLAGLSDHAVIHATVHLKLSPQKKIKKSSVPLGWNDANACCTRLVNCKPRL